MNSRYALAGSGAIALLIVLSVYLTFGMYLEDNETLVAAIYYGVFGNMTFDQFVTDYSTFLVPLLFKVSQCFPNLPVHGLWQLFHLMVWLTALIYCVSKEFLAPNNESKTGALMAIAALVYLTIDSIFYQHCIRQTILLGFAALLLNWQSIERTGKTSTIAILVFSLGIVVRMHSPMIVLALFLIFHLIRGMPFLKVMKHHWIMIVIGTVFILIYQCYGIYTNNMGRYIEANYEYAILEKKSFYPVEKLSTAKDSIKYFSLQKFFITDSSEFTKDFFERTVDLNYHKKSLFNKQNSNIAFAELRNKIIESKYNLLMLPLITMIMFFGKSKQIWPTLSFAFLSVGILLMLLLVLVDEIKIRFFSPYAGMVLWVMFIINFPVCWRKTREFGKYALTAIMVCLFLAKGINMYRISQQKHENEKGIIAASERLHNYTRSQMTIAFSGAEIPLRSNLLYRTPSSLYPNMAYFDAGYLTYFGHVKSHFESLFSCSPLDYPALIDLFEHNKAIRYYSTPDRVSLVSDYFKIVYSTLLKFEPLNPQPLPDLNGIVYSVTVERLKAAE